MNNQKKFKQLAELFTKASENEDAYFTFKNYPVDSIPGIESDLKEWDVIIPPKKWEPRPGAFNLEGSFDMFESPTPTGVPNEYSKVGMTGTPKELDERAKILKWTALVHAYVCEKNGGPVGLDNHKNKCYIFKDSSGEYRIQKRWNTTNPSIVYMPERIVELLINDIANRVVKL